LNKRSEKIDIYNTKKKNTGVSSKKVYSFFQLERGKSESNGVCEGVAGADKSFVHRFEGVARTREKGTEKKQRRRRGGN
jgi:hypothetical protein